MAGLDFPAPLNGLRTHPAQWPTWGADRPDDHTRGLRLGDPLSPMLSVIVMDVLNRLFVKAQQDNVLPPIGVPAIKHHCSLYADDAIVLLAPTAQEARAVKHIL